MCSSCLIQEKIHYKLLLFQANQVSEHSTMCRIQNGFHETRKRRSMFGSISLNIKFFYYMKKKSYTTMDLLVDRGCLYLCAIVIKVIQGLLNKSSSTGSILNLFSHIRGFNVIHKMFIYLLSGIHRLVHSKGRLGCSNS